MIFINFSFESLKDSIYGSRNLAKKMESTSFPQQNRDGTTELHRMVSVISIGLVSNIAA